MKRLLVIVTTAALVAVTAGAVSAAPTRFDHWLVTCDGQTTEVVARGVPGWNVELTPGTTPMLLLGGHVTVWEAGQVAFEGDDPAPPGVAEKLRTCIVEGPVGASPATFWVEYDPAYLLLAG